MSTNQNHDLNHNVKVDVSRDPTSNIVRIDNDDRGIKIPKPASINIADVLAQDILFNNRLDSVDTVGDLSANVEALFASSVALAAIAKVLSNTNILTSNTEIPKLFGGLSLAMAQATKTIQKQIDEAKDDTVPTNEFALAPDELNNIIDMLKNINIQLPTDLES